MGGKGARAHSETRVGGFSMAAQNEKPRAEAKGAGLEVHLHRTKFNPAETRLITPAPSRQ
jgi:hypothetical protein